MAEGSPASRFLRRIQRSALKALNHGCSLTGITAPETDTGERAEDAEHACMK